MDLLSTKSFPSVKICHLSKANFFSKRPFANLGLKGVTPDFLNLIINLKTNIVNYPHFFFSLSVYALIILSLFKQIKKDVNLHTVVWLRFEVLSISSLPFCYILTFDPAQRKWHIPMASNRKRSRGRIKAYDMEQGEGPIVPLQWCTGRE